MPKTNNSKIKGKIKMKNEWLLINGVKMNNLPKSLVERFNHVIAKEKKIK